MAHSCRWPPSPDAAVAARFLDIRLTDKFDFGEGHERMTSNAKHLIKENLWTRVSVRPTRIPNVLDGVHSRGIVLRNSILRYDQC
ncbi:hypothetical protein COL8621_00658 [Actibacterium lipolyticum]|uniref:Uncharacterized protein n=1 Tax=Actibacterium lipolyticum TaxID=1524263 RepID=A0A238JMS2_9RHOB|nr:hypothetical protein COL8621_00658 [Actibacterium lipolyticum]